MNFEEWWERHGEEVAALPSDRAKAEVIWNAAEEALLRSLVAAGDEEESVKAGDSSERS